MLKATVAAVVCAVCIPVTSAGADEQRPSPRRVAAAPGETPPVEAAPLPTESPETPTRGSLQERAERTGASRGFWFGTALTVPKGSWEISARSVGPLVNTAIAVGVTRSTEVFVDNTLLFEEDAAMFGAGIKQTLVSGERFRVSVSGAIRGKETRIINGGGSVTGCVDGRCRTLLTASAGILSMPSMVSDSDGDTVTYGAANFSTGSAKNRFQAEAIRLAGDMSFLLAGYRYSGTRFGVELGLAAAIEHGDLEIVLPTFGIIGRL